MLLHWKSLISGHKPTTGVTGWIFGHAEAPHKSALKEPLTLVLVSAHSLILLAYSNFGEWLLLHDFSGQSSTRNILLPLSGEAVHTASHLFRGLPAVLNSWIYGTLGHGCGALQGQQCHCPWENGSCITGLWALPTALRCPDTTSAPLLHAEVGNGKKNKGKKKERCEIK